MPKGPKGQKRPADVIGNAVKVMRIATGEDGEGLANDDGKDAAAAYRRSIHTHHELEARGSWLCNNESRMA
jgi:hypothetical protein